LPDGGCHFSVTEPSPVVTVGAVGAFGTVRGMAVTTVLALAPFAARCLRVYGSAGGPAENAKRGRLSAPPLLTWSSASPTLVDAVTPRR
jgi:hypothetical protein